MTGQAKPKRTFRKWRNAVQVANLQYLYSDKGLPLDLIADLLGMSTGSVKRKAREMKFRRPMLKHPPIGESRRNPAPEEGRPHGSTTHMDRA